MASIRRQGNTGQEGGYVQRCVILNRDEHGYGLTVSGDNPVYVQSVKENSPASRAGVLIGDKIIKVNGASVSNSNHVEVVNLIKSGNFVALTLLGRPVIERGSNQSLVLPEKQRPLSLVNINRHIIDSDSYKLESLQRNLEQEKVFFQKTREQYLHDPSPLSQKELAESQIRIRALEDQLKVLSAGAGKTNVLRTKPASTLSNNSWRKIHSQHQRSQSVAGTRSTPPFKPASVTPDVASNHGEEELKPTSIGPEISGNSTTQVPAKQQSAVNDGVANHTSQNSIEKDSGYQSEESLLRQISETQIDYNSVPVQKQKTPKRTVSLRTFSKFYERQPVFDRPSTIPVKPTISPPIPLSPPVVHSETKDIVKVNHARSRSDELSLHSRTNFDNKDDEPVNVVTTPEKLAITSVSEEPNMEGGSLLPGGVIETLQPISTAMSVISMEEEEFDSDNEKIDDHGPFVDLNMLKSKPAHLSVFLHFVMANSDPSALLFWLVTETYAKEEGSLKDLKKWAYEIFSTFLAQTAPLKVCIPESIELSIADNLRNKNVSEDDLKGLFRTSRAHAFTVVSEQLAEFRSKRALGLGSLFGDHQLEGNLDREKELKIVEQTLLPHLENLSVKVEKNNKESILYAARNSAMASSLTTFMKHAGVTAKTSSGQLNHLDLHKSFAEKERSSLFKFKGSKKIVNIKGHQFVGTQYTECTLCNICESLLWGIGTQGLQCQSCEFNVHKGACLESIEETCSGKKGKLKIMVNPTVHKPMISKIPGIQRRSKHGKPDQPDTNDVDNLSPPNSQVETRSRGNSINEDQDKLTSQLSEEQAPSDQEVEKSASKSHPPLEDTLSEQTGRELKRNKHENSQTKKNNLGYSQSVSVQREFVRLIDKDRKKTITSLSGLKLPGREGLNTDNGVYTAQPYQRRSESPSLSDEDDEQDDYLELEDTPCLPWSQTVDKKTIKKLKDKEVKRQEVIHEWINTEKAHVRHLKVLEKVFLKPMKKKQIMPPELIQEIFPNLDELIEIHTSLLAELNSRCAEQGDVISTISDIILARFDGPPGETAKEVAAVFNQNQRMAMEILKNRIKKDPKVAAFMARQEGSRYCGRLKFNDIMANTHQRLTKYPLLLREMLKATPSSSPDHQKLERCRQCCMNILDHVNKRMKETENKLRLIELSKKIDMKALEGNTKISEEFKDFDLTKHKLIHEGDLVWRINRTKTIDLHVLLLDFYMILLQKQDDKLVLKSHSTTLSTGIQDMKTTHSPIIKLQTLLTRDVATDKKAFFLVSTSSLGPQIYELVTSTITERNTWVHIITEYVDTSIRKAKERGRRGALCLPQSPSVSLSESMEESKDEIPPHESSSRRGSSGAKDDDIKEEETQELNKEEIFEEYKADEVVEDNKEEEIPEPLSKERVAELIDQLRSKDDQIRTLLEEKGRIVAELRCQKIGPYVSLESPTNDSQLGVREIIFSAMVQADRLTKTVSEMLSMHHRSDSGGLSDLRTSRAESSSSSIVSNGMSRQDTDAEDENSPQQPREVLVETTATINDHLTTLMRLITEDEGTKERLRSDLQESLATIKRLKNVDVVNESGESPDVVATSSIPSLGSHDSTSTASTQKPDIFIMPDDVSEDSSRSEVFEEVGLSDSVENSSPIQSVSSDDPVLIPSPFKSPKGRSNEIDVPANERVERSLSFPGSTRNYSTDR